MLEIIIKYTPETSRKLMAIMDCMTMDEYWEFLHKAFERGVDEKFNELFPE